MSAKVTVDREKWADELMAAGWLLAEKLKLKDKGNHSAGGSLLVIHTTCNLQLITYSNESLQPAFST